MDLETAVGCTFFTQDIGPGLPKNVGPFPAEPPFLPKSNRATEQAGPAGALTEQMLRANSILQGVDDHDVPGILEAGELITLATRAKIYDAEEPIGYVYFPIDAVLSVVTTMKEGGVIEVGTIGREGTSAIPFLLGATTTANDCYCQVPGAAIRLRAEHFNGLRARSAKFRSLLDRYLQGYVNFLGQLAGCNRLHSTYERCSRWLLLTHDRVGSDTIRLTHEYLAMMLGSRRSGVTIALSTFRRAGFITYANGQITVLDRAGLLESSCECYAVAQAQFDGLLRPVNEGLT
jgi:CRP-like cAMP-binding protein